MSHYHSKSCSNGWSHSVFVEHPFPVAQLQNHVKIISRVQCIMFYKSKKLNPHVLKHSVKDPVIVNAKENVYILHICILLTSYVIQELNLLKSRHPAW